ncbi:MAG: hypothetical protein ACRDT2_07355, partial [Natronosporangium sp.]
MDVSKLRALEPLCARAPSAHNTQPWRLSYQPDSDTRPGRLTAGSPAHLPGPLRAAPAGGRVAVGW